MFRKNLGVGGAAAMLLTLVSGRRRLRRRRRWRRQRHDRTAPAGEPHAALRGVRPAQLRGKGQGAVQRLQAPLQQRDSGRRQAAEPGRRRAHAGRGRAGPGRGRRGLRRLDRDEGKGAGRARRQLRPPRHGLGRRLLRLVRQRARRQVAGRHADQGTQGAEQAHRPGRDAGRRPGGQQCQAVQEGRERHPEGGWSEDPQVVRHAGMERRQGPERDAAVDHVAGQRRLRRSARRERRPRRRRDRGDEVSRDQARRTAPPPARTRRRPDCSGFSSTSSS